MMLEVELLPLKTQHPIEDDNNSPVVGVRDSGRAGYSWAKVEPGERVQLVVLTPVLADRGSGP